MTDWQRPSLCASGGCPEAARVDGWIVVRDSARPEEKTRFSTEGWRCFVAAVRAGEYDHLTGDVT